MVGVTVGVGAGSVHYDTHHSNAQANGNAAAAYLLTNHQNQQGPVENSQKFLQKNTNSRIERTIQGKRLGCLPTDKSSKSVRFRRAFSFFSAKKTKNTHSPCESTIQGKRCCCLNQNPYGSVEISKLNQQKTHTYSSF